MKITFLGTGTSTGVPMIACHCAVCKSPDPLNRRLRSSILLENGGLRLVVDAPTDFRTQCLRAKIDDLDSIICTHEHADHVFGLDEVRRFCTAHDKRMPIYGAPAVLDVIRRIFPYAFVLPVPYKGLPEFDPHEINGPFQIGTLQIIPYTLPHGPAFTTLGLEFRDGEKRMAYFTDCSRVPTEVRQAIRGIPLLILDALRYTPHPTHLNLEQALEVVADIRPQRTLFTHLSHEFDHRSVSAKLPAGVAPAYDEQVVEL